MQYQSIILELIQLRPALHERLIANRSLLTTVQRFASLLKESHQAWIQQLRQERPEAEDTQLASEALELALEQIETVLPTGSDSDEMAELSLDDAIQFLRNRNPQN